MMKVTTLPPKPFEVEVPLSLQAARELVFKRGGEQSDDPVLDKLTTTADDISRAAERCATRPRKSWAT